MDMSTLKNFIITLALVVFISAATALAIDSLRTSNLASTTLTATCNTSTNGGTGNVVVGCGATYNVSSDGLLGIDNTSTNFPVMGTIAGVVVLIGLVVGGFYFATKGEQ